MIVSETVNRVTSRWLQACVLLCAAVVLPVGMDSAVADVTVDSPLTSNMVLQRGMDVPVWGGAAPNATITVSFNSQRKQTTADGAGKWKVVLSPMTAGGPHQMTIQGEANTVILRNVLVGEVWICTGQSNMGFPLGAFRAKYDANVEAADMTDVRLVNFDTKGSGSNWRECTPDTARGFSATGFFFGRELHRKLNVPIGLIEGALGGTQLETWMSPAAAEECPGLKWGQLYKWKVVGENYPQIKAMMPYAIRGAIWYQGEMNGTANTGHTYAYHFAAMIKHWRRDWGLGEFPVLYVQLPNFLKRQTDDPKDDSQRAWPALREAQRMCLNLKNTGMAVTIDIGMADNIHPTNKLDVGRRLALNARALVYGEKELVYSGPMYQDMEIKEDRIRLNFTHVGAGLVSATGERLKGFGIAGDDRQFVWADAVIDGDSVVVSSPEVPDPKHVVYAWAINPIISLYNKEGLPASPFRTWTDPPPKDYKDFAKPKTEFESETNPTGREQEATAKARVDEAAARLDKAKALLESKDYFAADKLLQNIAAVYKGTPSAKEAGERSIALHKDPVLGPKVRAAAAAAECRRWMVMARNYLNSPRPQLATPYLRKIIARYPGTTYAESAESLLRRAKESK